MTGRRAALIQPRILLRGIYHEGWTAVIRHSTPWVLAHLPAFADDVWELYGPDDWTLAKDLAKENPNKLEELKLLFLIAQGGRGLGLLPLEDQVAAAAVESEFSRRT